MARIGRRHQVLPRRTYSSLVYGESSSATLWIHLPCQDNAATTTVTDTSGNGNDGELNNGGTTASYVTAGPGESYPSAFDGAALGGAENIILFPTITWSLGTNNISVGIWVYGPLTGTTGLFGDIGLVAGMSIESGVLEFRAPGDGDTSIYSLSLGSTATQWHFLHFQFKADGTITVYQNGTLLGDMTFETIMPVDFVLGFLAIDGFTLNRSSTSFCGFKAYNGITTSAQIAADYALGHSNNVTCTPGSLSLALTGYAPTAQTPRLCTPGVKALTTTMYAPTVSTPRVCTPGVKSLSTTTYAPTVSTPRTCTPGVKTLNITTYAPTVSTPKTCTPGVKTLTTTTYAPTITTPRTCTPGVLALTLTGFAPVLVGYISVVPGVCALSLTKFAPTVQTPRTCTPGALALSTTCFAPTALTPRTCTPGVCTLATTRYAPTVTTPRTVTPGIGTLALTGFTPSVFTPRLVTPGIKTLSLAFSRPLVLAGRSRAYIQYYYRMMGGGEQA